MGYKRSSSTGRHTAPAKASSVPLAIFQRRSHEGRGGGEKQSRKNSARSPRRWSPPCQRFQTDSPSAPLPPELSVRAHGQTEVASIYLPQELGAAAAAHAPLQHEGAGRGQRGAPGVPGHRGACPGEAPVPRPFTPQLAWPLPPGRWEAWVGGGGGRVSPAPRAGQAWGLLAPLGPRRRAPRWEPRLPKPARVPWPPSVSQPAPKTATGQCGAAPAFFEPRREKLTMQMDSLMEEKLECSLWCCVSDPSLRSLAARCCVLERHIVP
ncbi:lysophospholipid acyltransferase LPCAT4 isoform X4 [Macaca fascicularis]|uniref:lysophospholipid acyltransferase LPCAT4 isoform X4 n=1 Tax=Macaca fascicularis TaxID=9541 RepID=UPI003D15795B